MDATILYDQIAGQDAVEWTGLLTGLIYVFLATYQRPSCWIFGIISSACIAWKSYTDYHLMADVALQVFYIVIGVLGLWQWLRKSGDGHQRPVVTSSWSSHLIMIGICAVLSWPLSWWLIHHAAARYGYPDTLLTLLSIWATLLLIRKDLNNWVYWIVIDLVYTVLYWNTEGYLFALLFMVYGLISIWGFQRWRRDLRHLKET